MCIYILAYLVCIHYVCAYMCVCACVCLCVCGGVCKEGGSGVDIIHIGQAVCMSFRQRMYVLMMFYTWLLTLSMCVSTRAYEGAYTRLLTTCVSIRACEGLCKCV